MCVNSLSQGLNVDLPKAGLEPRTSRSESRASTTTPRRHTVLAAWKSSMGAGIDTVNRLNREVPINRGFSVKGAAALLIPGLVGGKLSGGGIEAG
ncbi:hypothetical protein ElyMa_004954500 [Elysia marginata]|uniref:Uncharacterized protein n=1 Tax=Elysia marginata TaxID=1093978 RepID=A0AAV4J211_9GAST|nr:hypothetical protein ElyMa_004954500 [Elysia marginata]